MGKTRISWTEETWNPTIGCSEVSLGCKNCYAKVQAASIVKGENTKGRPSPYEHVIEYKDKIPLPRWNGKVDLLRDRLDQPIRWTKPRMIFVNSMSDLFHESLTNDEIAAVFAVMAATPRHTYQILTKRPARMLEWFAWVQKRAQDGLAMYPDDPKDWRIGQMLAVTLRKISGVDGYVKGSKANGYEDFDPRRQPWPLPNVWLGVSCENQEALEERVPLLLQVPAAVRWVSAEPLLGWLNFTLVPANLPSLQEGSYAGSSDYFDSLRGRGHDPQQDTHTEDTFPRLDWVVLGGESGGKARDCQIEDIRDVVGQCLSADVPVFVKQLGSKALIASLDDLSDEVFRDLEAAGWDGTTPIYHPTGTSAALSRLSDFPEDLRVRQWPKAHTQQETSS